MSLLHRGLGDTREYRVKARGQFDQAGVVKGHVIVGIGKMRVKSSEEFAAALKLHKAAGRSVTIIYKVHRTRTTDSARRLVSYRLSSD